MTDPATEQDPNQKTVYDAQGNEAYAQHERLGETVFLSVQAADGSFTERVRLDDENAEAEIARLARRFGEEIHSIPNPFAEKAAAPAPPAEAAPAAPSEPQGWTPPA